jgi:hypothetical protein
MLLTFCVCAASWAKTGAAIAARRHAAYKLASRRLAVL